MAESSAGSDLLYPLCDQCRLQEYVEQRFSGDQAGGQRELEEESKVKALKGSASEGEEENSVEVQLHLEGDMSTRVYHKIFYCRS